jgi:FKBP-type peptidyl-prolyl cis-trans isomerase
MKRSVVALSSLFLGLALALNGCASKDGVSISPTVKEISTPAPAPAQMPAGIQTTYSGLKYEVLRPGTGARPSSYNRVKVHYHGYLPDGTVFDSSVQRGTPSTFGLNQVIAGWREGIPLMQEGAKFRFTVPPQLAYGARGMPPKIGPTPTLMFDVELLEVLY